MGPMPSYATGSTPTPLTMPTASPGFMPSVNIFPPVLTQPPSVFPTGPIMTAAGPLAQTVPLGPAPLLPRPEELAPCLFSTHIPYGMGYIPPQMSNFYNTNTNNTYPWGQPPQAITPPAPNPAAQPLSEPAAQKPPTPPKPTDPLPTPVQDLPSLTPEVVQEINRTLNPVVNPQAEARLPGSVRLGKLLDADPNLLTKPAYREYAEALILKALRDKDPLVRYPVLMSMELGNVHGATPAIFAELKKLKREHGLMNFEAVDINKLITTLQQNQKPAPAQLPTPANGPQPPEAPPMPAAQALLPDAQRMAPQALRQALANQQWSPTPQGTPLPPSPPNPTISMAAS